MAAKNKKLRIALINGQMESGRLRRTGRARICYLQFSSMLRPLGHDLLYLDADLENLTPAEVLRRTRDFQPDVVGFSCFCEGRFGVMQLVGKMRHELPGALLIAGGHQFTHYAEDALTRIPGLDMIFRGESEDSFMTAVGNSFAPDSLPETAGITFRDSNGDIHSTEDAAIQGIKGLPLPDWSLVTDKPLSEFTIITSRGCVGRCNFCATGHRRLRFREPEDVLEEIRLMVGLFGRERMDHSFNFYDDSLTLSKRHLHAIMGGMIEGDFGIHWVSRARGDTLTPENVRHMKEAGCIGISTSFDAPNQKILDVNGKNEKADDIMAGIETASRAGIKVNVAILLGNVTETYEDSMEGVELFHQLKKMPNVQPFIGTLLIYPGTPLEHEARDNGCLPTDFSWYNPRDMERTKRRRPGSPVPSFENGIVPFYKLQAVVNELMVFSSQTIIRQYFKRQNLRLLLRPGTYLKGLAVASSLLKSRARRILKR